MTVSRASIAIAAALLAAALPGCGSEEQGKPIPASIRQELDSRLDETERRFDAGGGACTDITTDTQPAVAEILSRIPSDVDADVRRTVEDGFARLFALTAEQCDEEQDQDTETETTPEPVPPPAETQPETETVPTTPTPEPDEDGKGKGNGNGGGGGNNGGGNSGGGGGVQVPGSGGGGVVPPGQG